MHDTEYHPALPLTESQRSDYLKVVASLVLADGLIDAKELGALAKLCRSLRVSPETEAVVMETARTVDTAGVEARLEWIKKDAALCYALMIDAVVMVMADEKVVSAEAHEIAAMGKKLNIALAQTALIGRYVESVVHNEGGEADSQRLSRELSQGLFPQTSSPSFISRLFRSMRGTA